MTAEQVQEVLTSTESDRTRSTKDTDKFREAICSFSNDMPGHGKLGYLLIGVEDDGSLSPGFVVTDELQQQFAAYRDDGQILPQPMLAVYKQFHPTGGEFLVVEVQPSDLTPVRYRGRIHIRVGPRKATASVSRFIESSFTEKPVYQGGLQERVIWDYPPEAMRELLVNAILHRDYQTNSPVRFSLFPDRIEIQNTGGLYGEANPENFPVVTDYPEISALLMTTWTSRAVRSQTQTAHHFHSPPLPPRPLQPAPTPAKVTGHDRGHRLRNDQLPGGRGGLGVSDSPGGRGGAAASAVGGALAGGRIAFGGDSGSADVGGCARSHGGVGEAVHGTAAF